MRIKPYFSLAFSGVLSFSLKHPEISCNDRIILPKMLFSSSFIAYLISPFIVMTFVIYIKNGPFFFWGNLTFDYISKSYSIQKLMVYVS